MAALVFKVGALALKTMAKPLGDRFKNWVMTHPQYRQTVLSVAQVRSLLLRGCKQHRVNLVSGRQWLRSGPGQHVSLPQDTQPVDMHCWARCPLCGFITFACAASCVLQRIHGFEVQVTRKAEGKEGRAFIGAMTEEKSVELASKIASESFLFAVGARLAWSGGRKWWRSRRAL